MTKSFAFLLILAASALSLGLQTGGWIKFTSEEGRFSVLMPGPDAPKDNAETKTDSKLGQYTTHVFMKETEKGLFIAGWTDYAPEVRLDVQGELAANRDNFVKGVKAKVLSERPISLDGHPGSEFTAESAQATFKARIYVVSLRTAYMIIAVTRAGMDDSGNVNRFLSSFEVKTTNK